MDEPEDQNEEFATVRRYRDLSEAIVARSLLESAGIESWIRDENIARLEWQYSNLLGGLRLQVKSRDAEAAEEVLEQPIPDTIPFNAREDFVQPQCPRCGSIHIRYEGASRATALVSVSVLAVPLPKGGTSWTCDDCGARWHDTEDDTESTPSSPRAPEKSANAGDYLPRLGFGILPIVLALALLDAGLRVHALFWPDLVLTLAVLWFGRSWMTRTLLTRWFGAGLAIVAILLPALLTVWDMTNVTPVVGLASCLLIPIWLWDLFVRQPHKGRFARARAERRGYEDVDPAFVDETPEEHKP